MRFPDRLIEYFSFPVTPRNFRERLIFQIKIIFFIGLAVYFALHYAQAHTHIFRIFFAWGIVGVSFGVCSWFIDEIVYHIPFRGEKPLPKTIGHGWVISFIGLLFGFVAYYFSLKYVVPIFFPEYADMVKGLSAIPSLLQHVLPIYFIVAFFAFQAEIKKVLSRNLLQAKEVNQLLEKKHDELLKQQAEHKIEKPDEMPSQAILPKQPFIISRNNATESLDPDIISHISVEEHYSSIFLKSETEEKTIQVRLSLKEALSKLPKESFVQIHRSHIVNAFHVSHVEQESRNYQLFLDNQDHVLPISRHRVPQVLPFLEDFLKKRPSV